MEISNKIIEKHGLKIEEFIGVAKMHHLGTLIHLRIKFIAKSLFYMKKDHNSHGESS